MSYQILDTATIDGINWVLVKTVEHQHTKGTIKTCITYSVERVDGALDVNFKAIPEDRQRFWMKSKIKATEYFKSLTNSAKVVERSGAAALNRIFG